MERWLNLDRRIVFLVLLAALIPLIVWRVPQTFEPSRLVEKIYEKIEKLPPRSAIFISTDFDPQAKAELEPITRALLRHCFQKNLRVIGMTFWVEGAQMGHDLFAEVAREYEAKAGVDYVYLGFKPGSLPAIVTNLSEDISTTFEKDLAGNPTSGMEVLRGVPSLKQVSLMIDLAAGGSIVPWIIFGADKYKFPIAAGCTAVVGPDLYPWVQSDQLLGMMAGLRGAADYELLLKTPLTQARGIQGMPAQSAAHAIIILFVIFGNIIYFLSRRRKRDLT